MGVNLKKIAREHDRLSKNNRKKKLELNGDDVIFNFGGKLSDWNGCNTSAMSKDHEGRRVLRWVISNCEDIDEDIIDIIKMQLDEVYL